MTTTTKTVYDWSLDDEAECEELLSTPRIDGCERGSITIPYPHELGSDFKHRSAAEALCRKFAQEDAKKYGSTVEGNPWLRPMIEGGLPRGCGADSVFVFEERK